MATANNESAWSVTAASNNTADSTITSSDSQSPDTLDNDIRNIMAARARARADQGGALLAGGSANVLTVTTNQVLSSGHLAGGLRLAVRAAANNTSTTVTFAPDGLTAQNIKRNDGSALAVGDIRTGMLLDLAYNTPNTEWRAMNIAPVGAARASVSAGKISANQTVATTASTSVTFTSEAFDVGTLFASSAWTPPAGTVFVGARVVITNNSGTTAQFFLYILKDVSAAAQYYSPLVISGGSITLQATAISQADGSNVYTVEVASSAQPYDILLGPSTTSFFGYLI